MTKRKFPKSRWFLITPILFMMGYSIGLNFISIFFHHFLNLFGSSLTEKQFDQLLSLRTSHQNSIALFFALFIWMLSVCMIIVIQKFITEAKEEND